MEWGMLRTFGRVMPVLMPLSAIFALTLAIVSRGDASPAFWLRATAAVCIAITVVTTLTVNVPINSRTATWQLTDDSAEWDQIRARWHFFQGVRGGLFLLAFAMLAFAMFIPRRL
jgi:uncharacterized membrane protein